MVTQEDIQATCDDIVREFSPRQIILFGWHAYGTPTENSDVDLLVVMDISDSETQHQASEICQRIPRRRFSMDLLVRSQEEMVYRISHNDWFLREIIERGKVFYGKNIWFKKPFKKREEGMNPLTLEWGQKAERDHNAIGLYQQANTPDYDLI
ncbi:nucleotidyltransferase domain-containing protein, partial [Candidatus Poribacteria bacterium]|nr:nucleotidyltransferase domain-containing protein [Candidatus Poribacteria bacterium]